jgi:hypothetical protein
LKKFILMRDLQVVNNKTVYSKKGKLSLLPSFRNIIKNIDVLSKMTEDKLYFNRKTLAKELELFFCVSTLLKSISVPRVHA